MIKDRRVAAVVLAAGSSSRLGRPKQLVPFRGELLVNRAVRLARDAGADPVFVVLGAHFDEVFARLDKELAAPRVLINRAWKQGLSTSIALGVAAAERAGADDLMLMTCDQPAITSMHLRNLIATSRREHVVASTYAGRRGTPALFPEFAFHTLGELSGDEGARELLISDEVLTVTLPGGEFDVDTPTDLAELEAIDRRSGGPMLDAEEDVA